MPLSSKTSVEVSFIPDTLVSALAEPAVSPDLFPHAGIAARPDVEADSLSAVSETFVSG